jgi:hypothetical protein
MKQMKPKEDERNSKFFASHFQIFKRFAFCSFITLFYINPLELDLSAQWVLE